MVNYTYGNTNWKDLLTAYNGNAITYDAIGNPLTYYNGTSFTWERGRKPSNAVLADGTSISYKYNDSGIRTSKTVDGVKTEYFLDGSRIIAEKTGNNTTWYYYDGDGTREAIEYNGNVYYYFYNAQGDVVGLFDNNLNVVVNYTYDSWGNVVSITGSLASTLGQDNPFRYRGYYFDKETNLYYLNSRYYDSNTGRFINADGLVQTGQGLLDNNMFAYCMNNPVNMYDKNGLFAVGIGITIQCGALCGGVITIAVVIDSSGNVGIMAFPGLVGCTPQGSLGISLLISWCDTIYDLEGVSYSVGGSIGDGGYIGPDFLFDGEDNFLGFMINGGVGGAFPFDVHAGGTIGEMLFDFPNKSIGTSQESIKKPKLENTVYKTSEKPNKKTLPQTSNKMTTSHLVYFHTNKPPVFYC